MFVFIDLMLPTLQQEWKIELENILTWWTNHVANNPSNFNAKVDIHNQVDPNADKGLVLFARILYTYSKAAIHLQNDSFKILADQAFQFIEKDFYDEINGGYYWSINSNGTPQETTKKTYGQSFVLYALVAYYELTKNPAVLNKALEVFQTIEKFTKEPMHGGYIEAFGIDWLPIDDIRLSDKDENLPKSMNTHLHVMEAYTALYAVSKEKNIEQALIDLINIFLDHIICNQTYHLHLFFTLDWKVSSSIWSYGHDIETSWLLIKAIENIQDKEIINRVKFVSHQMLIASLDGLDTDGGLFNEINYQKNHLDKEKHWWPQAEAMVGCWVGYKLTQDDQYLHTIKKIWNYIKLSIIDHQNGEWFWGRDEKGNILHPDEKAGFWKCPYHNGRALMELTRPYPYLT